METLSHDLIQWGGIAGAIFAMWRLFAMIKAAAAKEAMMQGSIRDLQASVRRLEKDDTETHGAVKDLREKDAALSERVAVIEERTKT